MSNEIITSNKESLIHLSEHNNDIILKPLSNEIHLYDSYVAGTLQLVNKNVLSAIKEGDKLELQRKNTEYDPNNIYVLTEDKKQVGYIPEIDNVVFARLMDAGKKLIAKVSNIKREGMFVTISIGIYLVDY